MLSEPIFWRANRRNVCVLLRATSSQRKRHSISAIYWLVCLALTGAAASQVQAQAIGRPGSTSPIDSVSQALTLRAVLERALTRYPVVQAAQARVRAARGSRATAGAFGNPVLSYEVDNTPFPGGSTIPGLDREAMTMATLPLEPLYQRGPRVRQANADVRAAEAESRAARQRVALDAANAFYRTAGAQVRWAAARDLASWLDSVVTYNGARVSQGAAAEADLIRSELERDRALAEVAMDAADLARARADLSVFLGDAETISYMQPVVADSSPFALTRGADASITPLRSSIDTGDIASLIRVALKVRPDLQAARERVQAARASVASEHTMLFRQVGATIGTKQTAGTTSMIAGVSLPFPLFDQNRGEVARATAEREADEFELAAQERTAGAEIAGAYEAARVLTAQVGALLARPGRQSYLARATEARSITFGAYREGAVPLLQVLDAARTWEEAQTTFYRVLFAQHQSILALKIAEGIDIMTTLTVNPSDASH